MANFLQSFRAGQRAVGDVENRSVLPIERAGVEIFTNHDLDQMARTVQRDLNAIASKESLAENAMKPSEWPIFVNGIRRRPQTARAGLAKLINSFVQLHRAIVIIMHKLNFPRERVNIARMEKLRAQGHVATLDVHELLAANEGSSHGLHADHRQEGATALHHKYLRDLLHEIHLALEGDEDALVEVNRLVQEHYTKGRRTIQGMLEHLGISSADTSKITATKGNAEHFYMTLARAIEGHLSREDERAARGRRSGSAI